MIFSQKKDIHTGYPYKKEHEASQNIRGTFACDDRSGDIRTVRTRQGSNIQKKRYPTDISFFVSLRARDGIRTRDPRLGKAILHH